MSFLLRAATIIIVVIDASSKSSPPPSSSSHRHSIDDRRRIGNDNADNARDESIRRLRSMIPPPHPASIGGEVIDDDAYARYLSVSNWDPNIAAPKMRNTLRWMESVRPGTIRPRHCPVLCRQGAWIALTNDAGRDGDGGYDGGDAVVIVAPPPAPPVDDDGSHEYVRGICVLGGYTGGTMNDVAPRRRRWMGGNGRRGRASRNDDDGYDGYDQPYDCPWSTSWRTTAHGLPVTHFRCWNWRPDLAGDANEMDLHAAYTMNHLIRRASQSRCRGRSGGGRGGDAVARVCIVFDLRGFETWMLPYIHRCVNLLREHYPGRAGAFVFINSPVVFRGVWGLISPWLDDELRSKVHFAPTDVQDVDGGIEYVNRMELRVGPV